MAVVIGLGARPIGTANEIEESFPARAEDLRATVKERLDRSAALADQG